jgi:uncharacterized protein (DUF2267 family)
MFEEYEIDVREFVKEVANELNNPHDHKTAIRITKSVFHAVRELLTVEESLHLISQLPLYVKALYVDGWHAGEKKRIKDKDEFIELLMLQNPRTAPKDFGNDEKALENARAVIRVLCRHVSQGQIDDIVSQFPAELKDLWNAETLANRP